MKYIGKTGEYFEVIQIGDEDFKSLEAGTESQLTLLWFEEEENKISIDAVDYNFSKNQIICISSFHNFSVNKIGRTKLLRFNEPFYCILNHDREVGCKGILFFGFAQIPIINPKDKDLELLGAAWKVLLLEMESRDNLQLEMLRMMLKRILILCTRVYKSQEEFERFDSNQVDLIREFNYLVEENFKTKHTVAEYAQLLNKSPKTISNLFSKINSKSPLTIIQDRIVLEARRLLKYTDLGISEIAYEIGFPDLQTFSRFFKKKLGCPPSRFREKS